MTKKGYIWMQKYCKYYLKKKKNHKVHITEGPTTLTAPAHRLKHRWVNVWFPLHWTNWTAPSCWLGKALDSHVVPPPKKKGAQWGDVDLCLTCARPSWLHLEDCLTSAPPPTSGNRVSRLYWTGYPFGNRVTRRYSLSYGDDESDRYRHNLRRNPSGTVVSPRVSGHTVTPLGLRQRNWLAKLQRGPKFPAEGGRDHKNEEPGVFFLIIIISSSISDWRIKDSFWSVQRWCQGII